MRARVISPPEKIRLFRPTKGKAKQRTKSACVEKAGALPADERFYFFHHLHDDDPPRQGSTGQPEPCGPKADFTTTETFWGKTGIRMQIFFCTCKRCQTESWVTRGDIYSHLDNCRRTSVNLTVSTELLKKDPLFQPKTPKTITQTCPACPVGGCPDGLRPLDTCKHLVRLQEVLRTIQADLQSE